MILLIHAGHGVFSPKISKIKKKTIQNIRAHLPPSTLELLPTWILSKMLIEHQSNQQGCHLRIINPNNVVLRGNNSDSPYPKDPWDDCIFTYTFTIKSTIHVDKYTSSSHGSVMGYICIVLIFPKMGPI